MIKFIKGLFGLVFLMLFMAALCVTAVMAIPFGVLLALMVAAAN